MLPASADYHKDTPDMHSQEALDAFTETPVRRYLLSSSYDCWFEN